MDPSFRIVPGPAPKSTNNTNTAKAQLNSFGLHDTLTYGARSIAHDVQSTSGLQARLEAWEETQDNLKLTMARNVQGLHAPMRVLMERKIVGFNPHHPALPTHNLALDILMGRDELLEPADFIAGLEGPPSMDVHAEMARARGM
ncbi:hypothetical protein HWV62_38640 [Athelia sp. TMB]|nr:hypothetical protein HWV62_38640 [Athelia sp. TMB]